jgi:molybdopterin synthase catalytic subunit
MHIQVRQEPFDPWQTLGEYQEHQSVGEGAYGATAVFVGTMRDVNAGDRVQSMTLEHYAGMTEAYLEKISQEAAQRWPILDSLVVHRVGDLAPSDPIVLVAVWSAHRAAAFDACRFLIEQLKSQAPFWKKEMLNSGKERWVEKNTKQEY